MSEEIVVLGATGFLGRHLCQRLSESGISIRPVGRRSDVVMPGRYHRLPQNPTAHDWIEVVRDARCVIDLIGYAHYAGAAEREVTQGLFEANVHITGAVIAACRVAGVEQLLYMSSIKAVAETSDQPLTSTSVCQPTTLYGQTKRAGEMIVEMSNCAEREPLSTVIRVPLVYGPDAKGNLRTIARAVQRGWPVPLPSHEGARSVASIERTAVALQALARTPQPPPVVHVCDPAPISFGQMVTAIAQGLGRRPRTVKLPSEVLGIALTAIGKRSVVSRWTEDLVMLSDGIESYPATDDEAGTLAELRSVAPSLV